jgi:hypothetical protein
MHLFQLLLPLSDNEGKAFPPEHYRRIRQELTEKFGGLTAFTRAPAEGLWKESGVSVAKDDIVIFEVMAEQVDNLWWRQYKTFLEKLFAQDEIIIRAQKVTVI